MIAQFSIYTLDLQTLELFRKGHRLPLQKQSARVLEELVRHAGEIITREHLCESLWGNLIHLDQDQAINKAIAQIRQILGDTPRPCRFVETLPRQGYRFIAPVTFAEPQKLASENAPSPLVQPPKDPESAPSLHFLTTAKEVETMPPATSAWWSMKPRWAVPLLVAAITLVGISMLLWQHHSRKKMKHPTVTLGLISLPPFEIADPQLQGRAEWLRYDITDDLGRLPGVRVSAAHVFTSVARDLNSITPVADATRVNYLLLASYKMDKTGCFLESELVRGSDHSHVAQFRVSTTPCDPHLLRERVVSAIYAQIDPELTNTSSSSDALKAYDLFLDGQHELQTRTNDSLNRAIAKYTQVLKIQPDFAPAYAGMANVYLILADRDESTSGFEMAERLANQAIRLDRTQSLAQGILGCIALSKDWDPAKAEQKLRLATDLNPDEATFHIWLASLLSTEGRDAEAVEQVTLARNDDPYWPPVYQAATLVNANALHFAPMLASASQMLRLTPDWPIAIDQQAWAFWSAHEYAKAINEWTRLATMSNDPTRIATAKRQAAAFKRGGSQAYARERLNGEKSSSPHNVHNETLQAAEWAAYANDPSETMHILQSMMQRHDSAAVMIPSDPAFLFLRDRSDFQSLIAPLQLGYRRQ